MLLNTIVWTIIIRRSLFFSAYSFQFTFDRPSIIIYVYLVNRAKCRQTFIERVTHDTAYRKKNLTEMNISRHVFHEILIFKDLPECRRQISGLELIVWKNIRLPCDHVFDKYYCLACARVFFFLAHVFYHTVSAWINITVVNVYDTIILPGVQACSPRR